MQRLPIHSHAAALVAGAALLAGCNAPVSPPQVSDADVTEHVKTALVSSAALQHVDITVVTTKGDVRLTAMLDTQAQVDEVLRIARAAEGVHAIHDELTIRK